MARSLTKQRLILHKKQVLKVLWALEFSSNQQHAKDFACYLKLAEQTISAKKINNFAGIFKYKKTKLKNETKTNFFFSPVYL